ADPGARSQRSACGGRSWHPLRQRWSPNAERLIVVGMTWTNWAGTATCNPVRVERPNDIDQLQDVISKAASDGLRVKAVGAGHSFTDVAVTDGVQLDMSAMNGVVRADAESGQVTVLGGTVLHDLNEMLRALGLSMSNLG